MSNCQSQHRYAAQFANLPWDQSSPSGRHRCAGCAYEVGYQYGLQRRSSFNTDDIINGLPFSQAGTVRHKSPYAAFAMGYDDGVKASYR